MCWDFVRKGKHAFDRTISTGGNFYLHEISHTPVHRASMSHEAYQIIVCGTTRLTGCA